MTPEKYLSTLFSVTGKTALVTGGSSGIGYMIASSLVQAGAHVYIVARKAGPLEEAARKLSDFGRCTPLVADVASPEVVDTLAANLNERENNLDILINNAGNTWGSAIEKFPDKAWSPVTGLNVQGPFMLIQRLLPMLEASASESNSARIINIGSIYGIATNVNNAYSYAASKAAIQHLSRVLAGELSSRQINVNVIAPGLFPSKMTSFMFKDETINNQVLEQIPMGRPGSPDEIAGLVLLLCSKAGAYITGNIIQVDGGQLLNN